MPNRKKSGRRGPDGRHETSRRKGEGSENGRIKKGLHEEAFFEIFASRPWPESLTQSEILSLGRDFRTN